MLKMIRNMFYFRIGQKASRGVARSLGLRTLAPVMGVLGGLRTMRRHS